MKKRRKAYFIDIINNNIYYHAFQRIKTKSGVFGWRYVLDKPLNEIQADYFKKFKNVIFGDCYYKYNPQMKYNTLILLDKCI